MNKITGILISILLIFSVLVPISLSAQAKEPSIFVDEAVNMAESIYLYSYDADRVLFSKGENILVQPSSSAKMMAGLLVCEQFSDKLQHSAIITQEMLENHRGTSMGLCPGMTVTVNELLYGTIFGNNDAALALAITCSGSISKFVDEMNRYAKFLDMSNTNYTNPTGLDDQNAFTTVRDTAKLAKKAAKSSLYLNISSTATYSINGQDNLTIYNRNALISQFSAQGYLHKSSYGLIAGSTLDEKYTLATFAQKDDSALLCLVMGAKSDSSEIYSYKIAHYLIDHTFNNYSLIKIASAGDIFESVNIDFAISSNVASCVLAEDVYAYLPRNFSSDQIKIKSYLHTDIHSAPIEKNSVLGGVYVFYGDTVVAEAPLVAKDTIEANFILKTLHKMRSFFTGRIFIITILLCVPTIITYLFYSKKRNRKNNYFRKIYKK